MYQLYPFSLLTKMDMIKLKKREDFYTIVQRYYNTINGVTEQ